MNLPVIATDRHLKTALFRKPSGRSLGALQQSGILSKKNPFFQATHFRQLYSDYPVYMWQQVNH